MSMVIAPIGVEFHTHQLIAIFQSKRERYNCPKNTQPRLFKLLFSNSNNGIKAKNKAMKIELGGHPNQKNTAGKSIRKPFGILFSIGFGQIIGSF